MIEKTRKEYISIANNFISKHIDGHATPKKLTDALIANAQNYRPAYWRRLRRALIVHQSDYPKSVSRLQKCKNPLTKDKKLKGKIKSKRKRQKHVNAEDEKKILRYFQEHNDRDAMLAILIAKYTGARPSEMLSMQHSGQYVGIVGSKKTRDGKRGADRIMQFVEEGDELDIVKVAIDKFYGEDPSLIKNVQRRIYKASRGLFPQRHTTYNLYSWRNQFASNLKASDLSRQEIAYLMGHQATKSVDQYGHRKKGSTSNIIVEVGNSKKLSQIRLTHLKGYDKKSKGNELGR